MLSYVLNSGAKLLLCSHTDKFLCKKYKELTVFLTHINRVYFRRAPKR